MQLTKKLFKLISYHIFSPVLGIILGEWAVYLDDAARAMMRPIATRKMGQRNELIMRTNKTKQTNYFTYKLKQWIIDN